MKRTGIILLLLSCFFAFCNAQNVYRVRASQADTYVVNDNDTNYVMINNSVPQNNKLLVFFPGTGALPFAYYYFLQTAANLGYHTIGLCYNNDTTIETLCTGGPASCKGLARAEVFYGKNYSDVENVDSSECIRTRLVALLKYLVVNYPAENWGQFLDPHDSIIWSQVCIGGHSQGSGMASIVSYWYRVYRSVFFATGGDWYDSAHNVDPWMEMTSQTPPAVKYAFTHRYDELFWDSLDHAPVIWDTLQLGHYIDFDTITTNYYHGHSFTSYDTTAIPSSIIMFHNCVVTNNFTPIIGGRLLYQPLWKYMLGDTVFTSIAPVQNTNSIEICPNPSKGRFAISISNYNVRTINVEVYNVLGERVYSNNCQPLATGHQPFITDLSNQPGGLYLYRVTNASGELIGEGKLVIQR